MSKKTPGVRWIERQRKWRSEIGYSGKKFQIGSFKEESDAIDARLKAEEVLQKIPNESAEAKYKALSELRNRINPKRKAKTNINIGDVFGNLTVIREAESGVQVVKSNGKTYTYEQKRYICLCVCGQTSNVAGTNLAYGTVKSCGIGVRH